MTPVAEKLQPWLAAIDQRPQGGPRWLQDLRDRAASRFAALGFPTARDEEWRFTSVAPIASAEFRPTGGDAAHATEAELAGYLYSDAAHRIVIVNGRLAADLSRTANLPAGVRVGSLAAAVTERADVVQRYPGQLADFGNRAFTALNTALASDGAYVYVPDGVVLEAPLHLLFVTTASPTSGPIMSNARALVVAGDRSQARIVETYVGPRGTTYFTNAVTEVFAGENAVVDHYRVQQESIEAFHVGSLHLHLARSSNVSSQSFSLGGKLVRNDVFALLDGEGAECTLNGLYLADGDRLVDNHTSIDHAKAHCPSHEIYKGILGGKARAVFNGKIIVRQDAQKTDAKQTNRALLLSDGAAINTKPQLEIFADDVKCTHGAAIGQLDEDAIFYLRARGLTYFEARDMLIHAFAGDILDRVKVEPLRVALEGELYAQLAKDLAELDGGMIPSATASDVRTAFDAQKVRRDFPILSERVHGKPLVYLDSANTSQKPESVLAAMDAYYRHANANIHRATHLLSERATALYEGARAKAAAFVNTPDAGTIVLTRGATDSINLVAQSYGRPALRAGDEILISWLEHHSNIVPWQLLCEQTGAVLRVAPIDDLGEIDLDAYAALLSPRTRIVAVSHVSNALGTINPVREIVEQAHARGAVVLLDGAQAVPHLTVDVQALDCDFYVFSSHKMFGPTGVGVLYGRRPLLEAMPPYQGGGDMIASVTFEKTLYNAVPYKFEAGTPNIGGVVGFGAAVDYLTAIDREAALAHEDGLLEYATACVREIPGARIIGEARHKTGVLSFVLEGVHAHDAGTILDNEGVAVRTGQHCAQPVMDRFGLTATIRASLAIYNTRDDVDALVRGLGRVREVFT